jgi:hypothetical protein
MEPVVATGWSLLFVLGLLLPILLIAGSGWVVLRLARRLRGLRPESRPPWHWVGGHIALVALADGGVGSLLVLAGLGGFLPFTGSLGLLAMLVVPIHLHRSVRRASGPEGDAPRMAAAGAPVDDKQDVKRVRRWRLAAIFAATGVFLPWLVGLAVKLYLDSRGRPTLPVSDFLDPQVIPVLLIQTLALWAFPFLVLGSAVVVPWRLGFAEDPAARASTLPIWLAYAGGVLADVVLFIGVFWEFDALMLIVPLGLFLLPPMALGYLLGWWMVRRRHQHALA